MKALLKTTDHVLAATVADMTRDFVATITWRRDAGSTIERERIERPHVVLVDVEAELS
jgi:hypothetical protein